MGLPSGVFRVEGKWLDKAPTQAQHSKGGVPAHDVSNAIDRVLR